MPDLPYSYFVSYTHQYGFGCLRICTDSPVDRMDHVNEFRRTIERITRNHGIVVLWWKRLPGDEPTASGEVDAEGVADAAREVLDRRSVSHGTAKPAPWETYGDGGTPGGDDRG